MKNKQRRPSFEQIVFQELCRKWSNDIAVMSMTDLQHPLCEKILSYGPKAIPWLFQELRERRCHRLLTPIAALTKADPVPAEDAGKVEIMIDLYIQWGKDNGYL